MATSQRTDANLSRNSAVNDALAHVVARLRLARFARLVARGALIAVVASLVAVGLSHGNLLPSWLPLAVVIPVVILLGIGLGAAIASRRAVDQMAAARLVEARLGLKERLSSALEFEHGETMAHDPEAALLLRLQQQDAAAHARAFQAADAVPIKMPWEAKALIPAVILLILALVLPTLPMLVPPAVRNERAVVHKAGDKLAKDAKAIEKNADAKRLTSTKQIAQKMQKLGKDMAKGKMDKEQAMVKMSQLNKEMADQQRRLAEANGSATGQGGKSLATAGEQLAKSLKQSTGAGKSSPTKTSKQSGEKSGDSTGTPEVKNAAKSLQHGNSSGLSQQLRGLAQRADSGKMSPVDKKRAAADLKKLADALKGTPLSESQRHAQSAADAMKRGDEKAAADQMRQAADAADRAAQQQADSAGMQNAQQTLQARQQEMAQAGSPSDIKNSQTGRTPGKSGTTGSKTSQPGGKNTGTAPGNQKRASQSGGKPGSDADGTGKSALNKPGAGHYSPQSGAGQKIPSQGAGIVHGAPQPLDPKFDPAKNPKYGKIYLGAGDGAGGKLGPIVNSKSGTQSHASSVPYYNQLAPARKTAESVMDKEDIPPSYRNSVHQYFDSLRPTAGKPGK